MNRDQVEQLLQRIAAGTVTPEEGLTRLRFLPYEDVGFARIDHHRSLRQGVPEVIYCEGKTVEQVRVIGERILNLLFALDRGSSTNHGCCGSSLG